MDTGNQKPWEERLHETGVKVEEEVKRLVQYLETEVLPDVRRHSSTALRAASDQLTKLAQHLEEHKPKGPE